MDTDKKLDQIIALLKEQSAQLEKIESSKSAIDDGLEKAKEYLLKHYNIKWIGDDIESSVYDVIIEVIKKFI